jgi:hypothetical protein
MERDSSTREFMDRLEDYVRYVVPHYIAEGKSYLTVSIGCTGGRHRSVALAEELGRARLAAVSESHTPSGKHETTSVPFPDWVPRDVLAEAREVDLEEARSLCAPALGRR